MNTENTRAFSEPESFESHQLENENLNHLPGGDDDDMEDDDETIDDDSFTDDEEDLEDDEMSRVFPEKDNPKDPFDIGGREYLEELDGDDDTDDLED